jgi:hypothetical protein
MPPWRGPWLSPCPVKRGFRMGVIDLGPGPKCTRDDHDQGGMVEIGMRAVRKRGLMGVHHHVWTDDRYGEAREARGARDAPGSFLSASAKCEVSDWKFQAETKGVGPDEPVKDVSCGRAVAFHQQPSATLRVPHCATLPTATVEPMISTRYPRAVTPLFPPRRPPP